MLFLLWLVSSQVCLEQTDTFDYLDFQNVKIIRDTVFYVHQKNAQLLMYPQGHHTPIIAANRGQGPNELNLPSEVFQGGDSLFIVSGFSQLKEFDSQGNLVRARKIPQFLRAFSRIEDGFLVLKSDYSNPTDQSETLLWFNDDFSEQKALLNWEVEPMVQSDGVRWFNPVSDISRLVVTSDMKNAFLTVPGESRIQIWDPRSLERVGEIKINEPRIPFNREWGQMRFDWFVKRVKNKNYKPHFPEWFPVINHFCLTFDDRILVHTWSADSGPKMVKQKTLTFLPDGRQVRVRLVDERFPRVLGAFSDGRILISTQMNEDDEFTFCILNEDEVEAYLEDSRFFFMQRVKKEKRTE